MVVSAIKCSANRDTASGLMGSEKGYSRMNRRLAAIAVILVVAFATACGSAGDENSVASLPTADISSFPTPSRSQATRQPDPQPTSPAPAAETQDDSEDSDDAESLIADAPPITAEEIQELRERLGRGELSEEEAQEVFLRLREQFGGGQGGIGPGGFGARRPRARSRASMEIPSPSRQNSPRSLPLWERTPLSALLRFSN